MAKATAPDPSQDWELTVPLPIEPGVYPATVKSVERKVAEDETEERPWLLWTVTLEDGREVSGGSSFSISPRSKPYAWISALIGRAAMGGGQTIHPFDLMGKPCQVQVDSAEDGSDKLLAILPPPRE